MVVGGGASTSLLKVDHRGSLGIGSKSAARVVRNFVKNLALRVRFATGPASGKADFEGPGLVPPMGLRTSKAGFLAKVSDDGA